MITKESHSIGFTYRMAFCLLAVIALIATTEALRMRHDAGDAVWQPFRAAA